jgi:Mrp family chromosome partitioning ATPase
MQSAVEAYRTLRTRLVKQQTRNGARSLVVTGSTQGEGKTLTTFNLALCYAKIENWPVLLVDADLRTRGLSNLAGDPDSPGLAEILENGGSYQSAILSSACWRNHYFTFRAVFRTALERVHGLGIRILPPGAG